MPASTKKCEGCNRDIDVRGFPTHVKHCVMYQAKQKVPVVNEEPPRRTRKSSSRTIGKFAVWLTTKGSEYVALHTLEEILFAFQQETDLEVGTHSAKCYILGEGWKIKRKVSARYTADSTLQVLALALASLYRQLGENMPDLFVEILQGRPVDVDALNRFHEQVASQDFVNRVIPISAHG